MFQLRTIIVIDFETLGKNPDLAEPVEVACLAINTKTLKVIKDSEFSIDMRPTNIHKPDFLETITGYSNTDTVNETLNWHVKQQDKSRKEILERWENAPDQKYAFEQLCSHIRKFNWKDTYWTAPVMAGINIKDYDLVILDKLCKKYNVNNLYWRRDYIDILNLAYLWLSHVRGAPSSYSMDSLRKFFGISSEGNTHEALVDIRDECSLIIKFLRLHKFLAPKINFKNACYKEN